MHDNPNSALPSFHHYKIPCMNYGLFIHNTCKKSVFSNKKREGKMKLSLVVVVFSLLVLCASVSVAWEAELKECKQKCRIQRQFDTEERQQCETGCEEYIKEEERKEREGRDTPRRHQSEREERERDRPRRHEYEREERDRPRRQEAERVYKECRERCQEREDERRPQQLCESDCEKQRFEREREERRSGNDMVGKKRSEEEEEEFGGKSGRPFVFEDQHFSIEFKDQQGRIRVLENFSERSRLFKGIEDYRVMIFESQPQTFVVPNHFDADVLLFVAQGKGTLSLVYPDRSDSFNIERGHLMVIPAGVTAYLINRGNNEKLAIVKLINPVANPGNFEQFFGPGDKNPESFFNAFSNDILEAAFKTSGDKLQKIFSHQNKGAIIKASQEQIRALTQEKSGHWPFSGKGSGPYNLLNRQPKESNEFGSVYEVDSDDYKQLDRLNVAVSFGNLTQGSMHTPFYNSRATIISVVLRGKGRFEMACPHVSKSGQREHHDRRESGSRRGDKSTSPIHYEKINSNLRQGTVFVVPPGHPFVTVASEDENLETICFEVNAENNHKVPLAGQKSVYKNLEREAKELAFAVSADVVNDVLKNQEEEFFFRGPRQQDPRRGFSII